MQLANLSGRLDYRKFRDLYQSSPVISASTEVILTVFAVSFMVFLALRPTLTIVAELRRKIEDQTEVNQKLSAKIRALQSAQQSLTENAASLSLYQTAVPDEVELVGIAKRMELTAQKNGVAIDSLKFEAVPLLGSDLSFDTKTKTVPVKAGEVLTLIFSANIEGSFDAVHSFVEDLEKMDRLVKVTSLSIEKQTLSGKGAKSFLEASIKGETYYKFGDEDEN